MNVDAGTDICMLKSSRTVNDPRLESISALISGELISRAPNSRPNFYDGIDTRQWR